MHNLMVSAAFPCSRAVKMAQACKTVTHDALCQIPPPHMAGAFRRVIHLPRATDDQIVKAVREHPAEVIHVHGDLGGFWMAPLIREATDRPIVLNVHDLPSDREMITDLHERDAFEVADALVWVTDRQRQFAAKAGLSIDKPSCTIANYVSSEQIVTRRLLPHIGGVCYEGGAEKRGSEASWRDLSNVADTIDLHLYPGNSGVDYGIVHPTEFELSVLMHRLTQHDWGFLGVHPANDAWSNSIPNKVFEYMAAGLPFIALNVPLVEPLAEEGLGICVDNLRDLKKAVALDPKPYAKRVRQNVRRYTMEARIDPLIDLYQELRGSNAR